MNYALQPMSKAEFITAVTDGLSAAPNYFALDATLNKHGYASIDEVLVKNTKALTVDAFEKEIADGALVLDVRDPGEFEKGFVPGAVNIGLNGQYAPWVGELLDASIPLVLIADKGKEAEAVLRLARVGYENVNGYLEGGIAAWQAAGKSVDTISSISAYELAARISSNPSLDVLDVRKAGEVESGMIEGAHHICLSKLQREMHTLDQSKHYFIHCAGGYRSMMAASILKRKGFSHITNIHGGMARIRETGIRLVQPVSAI